MAESPSMVASVLIRKTDLDRLNRLRTKWQQRSPYTEVTRSDVHRRALRLGLAQLEAEEELREAGQRPPAEAAGVLG